MTSNGRMHGPLWKFFDWLVPPALFVLGWMLVQVVEMRSNRFTSEDGRQLRASVHANALAVQRLQGYIETLQANNSRWLDHHEKNLDEIERAFERHTEANDPHRSNGR